VKAIVLVSLTDVTTCVVAANPFARGMFLAYGIVGQGVRDGPAKARKVSLADRVAADLAAILPADLGPAAPELPVTRDLTTYRDALTSAVKNCPHENVEDDLHGRSWQCVDCGRYLDLHAMRERQRRRGLGGLFGW
jgi:hypothetical protein